MRTGVWTKVLVVGIILLFLLTASIPSTAQDKEKLLLPTPDSWIKTFARPGDDIGGRVLQTVDGGYIIFGSTEDFGPNGCDVWLIKTDGNGDMVWNKTFGGTDYQFGISGQQTTDGGFIIIGSTGLIGPGWTDVLLIKTDANGNEEWNKTFGGDSYDSGSFVQQTSDDGYIIIGYTYSYGVNENTEDVWLIKTDSNGNKIWDKTFGGISADGGSSVHQTTDGGYIMTGYTYSYGAGAEDLWLIKTDGNGNKLWDKTFGSLKNDIGSCVLQTVDGGYIITGTITSLFSTNMWLIKTDTNGNKVWNKHFGGISFDFGSDVQQTSDGGFIIAGSTLPNRMNHLVSDVYLLKTDSNGKKQWESSIGGIRDDMGYSVQQTSDGGYIITGSTTDPFDSLYRDLLLIKTDSQGKVKTLSSGFLWFERFFQRFPNTVPILRQLMEY